jgi:hypothetical protein
MLRIPYFLDIRNRSGSTGTMERTKDGLLPMFIRTECLQTCAEECFLGCKSYQRGRNRKPKRIHFSCKKNYRLVWTSVFLKSPRKQKKREGGTRNSRLLRHYSTSRMVAELHLHCPIRLHGEEGGNFYVMYVYAMKMYWGGGYLVYLFARLTMKLDKN